MCSTSSGAEDHDVCEGSGLRYLEYIMMPIYFGSPWAMGKTNVQIIAWMIGMIVPVILASGLLYKFNKTVAVFALFATVIAIGFVVWWLVELDFWMHAPPTECGGEACDNDGTIRMLFMAGVLLLPVAIPSALSGPLAFLMAIRRILTRQSTALVHASKEI
jgi:hypothetical protein